MLTFVRQLDISEYLTSEQLANEAGIARTTLQRRVARGDLVPDVIAPRGVFYWRPSRVGQLAGDAQPP